METLEGLLKAYKARLKTTKTLKQRWKRYHEPMCEKQQLELYKCLAEATQALLDKVSQPQQKVEEGTKPRTYDTKEEEPDRHTLETPFKRKSARANLREPRRYPASHVLEVQDAMLKEIWEELK